MLEAIKFPARIADLNTGLADVDRDALSHFRREKLKRNQHETKKMSVKEKLERGAFIKTPLFCNLQRKYKVCLCDFWSGVVYMGGEE